MSTIDNPAVTSVFGRTGEVAAAEGDYSLGQLTDVVISAPGLSQVLTYNGAAWANQAPGGGGSDPWTYVKLAADFPTSSATAVNVTGLAFTPAASLQYEIYGLFLLRTNTATVGPRPGCTWPTGLTDGVVAFRMTSAAGTQVLQNGNFNAAVLCPVGGLPNTTQSYPAIMDATLITGPTPSSTFQVRLASETAGTTVIMKTGSFIRYRTI